MDQKKKKSCRNALNKVVLYLQFYITFVSDVERRYHHHSENIKTVVFLCSFEKSTMRFLFVVTIGLSFFSMEGEGYDL